MDEPLTYTAQCNDGCSDPREPTSTRELYPRRYVPNTYDPETWNTCKWATSAIVQHKVTGVYALRGVTCKRWNCPPCARRKIKDLAWWTKLASPNRLLTLTVDPKLHDNPELAWLSTAPKVPEVIRALRKRFGSVEYLRVIEETDKGWPHYHMMVRSGYLPQQVVKREWNLLTGAQIVDVREVKQFFNSYQYLVKYLTKLHHVGWTERHVTYSRSFFPVGIGPGSNDGNEWRAVQTMTIHPCKYLELEHPGQPVMEIQPLVFELKAKPCVWVPPNPAVAPLLMKQRDLDF